ncbi:PREDICTED: uncharacterized protein LOC106313819 [Brassica oleracea var. oleracea]|uniref:Uncharacterized protein n=1 Tax=Brassica oleracea var. oleracea TaxID=109376 RepID=A0A0D3EFT6_BRAOL|nr:PREDICTED: uncharacterized protein LOC106313819 [Brassica oleracea var. oleracea]
MAGEDFRSRVDRIFGSLAFSRSTSPTTTSTSSAPPLRQTQSGSVWSLSGAEVEKREWKREQLASYDREEMPCASSFDEILRQQRLSSTDRKEGEEGGNEDFDVDDDDWSIRASMGLDRTLDDEDEEDEYDKVALGKEDGGKGLSMEDAISRPCGVRIRDPRANHAAAKMRLKEDELEANKISPSGVIPSKSKEPTPHPEESSKSVPPKPILKRKESCSDSEARTSKRVRFDVVTEETSKKPEDNYSVSASLKSALPRGKSGAQVPDYLVNPSKYTCYSFDPSSELNEKSQTQEFTDIPKDSKGLETSESESFKKVSFGPQKKTEDVREDGGNCSETKPVEAGHVAEDERPSETEGGDTEIEESESCNSFQRNGRQYRAKQSVDETDV